MHLSIRLMRRWLKKPEHGFSGHPADAEDFVFECFRNDLAPRRVEDEGLQNTDDQILTSGNAFLTISSAVFAGSARRCFMTHSAHVLPVLPVLPVVLLALCGCSGDSGREFQDYRSTSPATSASVSDSKDSTPDPEDTTPTESAPSSNLNPGVNSAPGADSSNVIQQVSGVLSPERAASETTETGTGEPGTGVTEATETGTAEAGTTESETTESKTGPLVVTTEGTGSLPESSETKVPEENLGEKAEGAPAAASEAVPAEPLKIQLLIPDRKFRREKNTAAVRVTYDDIDLLKILNMEPVPVDAADHFPDWLTGLDGQLIRIRGFMYPTFEATGLTAFTLARDNGICCFVRQPKIYDIIAIELGPGITSDYIEGKPFDVEGIFRVQPEADEKELYRLYRIENARVIR
jgi:hypothetical protein